ncbi:MAG: hypothetical protein H0X49_13305, partial [Acidobacteria bacterium]|nr:hypothetical protein [Acidobacteriota bacterium]
QGYIEMQTPTLIRNPFGADAKPFETDGYYLRIAPELELKKLVVGGFDKIYEIGKSFRNEGLSQKHNPEFTMLEIYTVKAGASLSDVMIQIQELLTEVILRVKSGLFVNKINWAEFSMIKMSTDFDELKIKHPAFLTGFSADESPLAASQNGVALRTELYVGGMELANGYVELSSPDDQFANFQAQGVVDTDYINALKVGLPPTFGVGIGIDRLIMLLTDRNIKEVI